MDTEEGTQNRPPEPDRVREMYEALTSLVDVGTARASGTFTTTEEKGREFDEALKEAENASTEQALAHMDAAGQAYEEAAAEATKQAAVVRRTLAELRGTVALVRTIRKEAGGDALEVRAILQEHAAQGQIGIRTLLDVLSERDTWWQQHP